MDSIILRKPDAEHRNKQNLEPNLKPKAGTNVQSHFTDMSRVNKQHCGFYSKQIDINTYIDE